MVVEYFKYLHRILIFPRKNDEEKWKLIVRVFILCFGRSLSEDEESRVKGQKKRF